jgi:2-oxoglutarate dehydrogenase E2 component (dihydrolipoamide succinyltransferase)
MTKKITVPQLGESVVEATVGQWHQQEGDTVTAGDILVELETDKVDVEVGAEVSGVLIKIAQQTGTDVQIGDVLGEIDEEAGEQGSQGAEEKVEEAGEKAAVPERDEGEKITPVARRLAEEQVVDWTQVKGSGTNGRITKQDIENYLQQQEIGEAQQTAVPKEEPAAPPTPKSEPAAPKPEHDAREERIRMSRRRRTIAQRLVEAQQTAAILTTFNDIDMRAVMELRQRRQESFQKRHEVKLGFMSFFVKAAIGALKAFPRLNAEIDGDEMVLKH